MNTRNFLIALLIVGISASSFAFLPGASAATADEIRAQIRELLAKVVDLQAELIRMGGTEPPQTTPPYPHRICYVLNRNIGLGMRGDDVLAAQEFLKEQGYLLANPTGYFGGATVAAVRKWQANEGVSSVGSLGPMSRERIKIWCGGNQNSDFSASPLSGQAPLSVAFRYHPGEEEGTYYIDYGDGSGEVMKKEQIYCITTPCISPAVSSHVYKTAGTYTASVNRYIACLYSNPRCLIAQPPPLSTIVITVKGEQTYCTADAMQCPNGTWVGRTGPNCQFVCPT